MHKYQVTINGIHCHSCVTLLNMYFEEGGLKNVRVDAPHNLIDFESEKEYNAVYQQLGELFASELNSYQFSNLILKP